MKITVLLECEVDMDKGDTKEQVLETLNKNIGYIREVRYLNHTMRTTLRVKADQ